MPRKPQPTRKRRDGVVEPNPKATALSGTSTRIPHPNSKAPKISGALQLGNSDIVAFASEAYLADVETLTTTTRGRYVRVRDAIVARFGCHEATAKRAMRDAELMRAQDAERRRPTLQARALEQLHRIADREEERQPLAAVAALREIGRIAGLHAPKKLEVTHSAEIDMNLDAILGVLDAEGNAAMQIVLRQIEDAKQSGRLALPAPDDVVDAEIVETEGAN